MTRLIVVLVVSLVLAAVARADGVDDLLRSARAAFDKGKADEAITLAGKAIDAAPKNAAAYALRGTFHESLRQHAEAVADFDKALDLDPKLADAYDRRGSEHFKLGHLAESLADFDRYLELRPEDRPKHWKRGITCYYLGKFDEGKKQFEGYEKVDTNDVENAVWHFLCNARATNVEKARAAMLKIGQDDRVPMMKVYDLYLGKAKPDDVLAAAREGDAKGAKLTEQLFYAHLYLGLYYEVQGDKKKALEHLTTAADDYKIGHYMWDVAHVHKELLKKEK
jgi:lipoprotein NlpI